MSRYYSSTDFKNIGQLFKILAGLGVVSFGAGAAYSGLKNYQNRYMEATSPDFLRPSKLVRNRAKDKKITIDDTYLPDTEKTAQLIGMNMKRAFTKSAVDLGAIIGGAVSGGVSAATAPKSKPLPERSWMDYFAGRRYITDSERAILKAKGVTFKDLDGATPDNSSALPRLQATLATAPNLRAAWFLPAATATALGMGYLGYQGVNYLNKMLGKREKPVMDYSEQAKQIYNESAKYLKDVAEGRDVDDPVEKRRRRRAIKTKKAEFTKESAPILSGDGTSSFWSLGGLAIGIPAALWTARQLRAFGSGVDSAREELADRTHMIRAWQAAAKERQYDYNNFNAELAEEPLNDATSKRIQKKEQDFIKETDKDDDNNNQLRFENYVFNKIRSDRDSLT